MHKRISFQIPEKLFGEFYKVFPGRGERSVYLTRMIIHAVELGPEARFVEQVKAKCRKEENGNQT